MQFLRWIFDHYSALMTPELIDPRGPRFTAGITTIVLATALLSGSWIPVFIQCVQFALGGFVSPKKAPYGLIYINLIQPRLSKDFSSEPINGPKFAQKVGFLCTVVALGGSLIGNYVTFAIAVAFALAAAFLNAVFNFCLGCEIYLIGQRVFSKKFR